MFLKNILKGTICVGLLGVASVGSAQSFLDDYLKTNTPKENSPFSRLGIGNYLAQSTAANGAFGGLSAGFQDAFLLNPYNPASLASLRSTSFELGLNARNTTVEQGSKSANIWSGNLGYLAIGFPTYSVINEELDKRTRKVRWGMGFSILPQTQVGYQLKTVEKHPAIDTAQVITNYVGSGNTYKIMWGNAISTGNFSAGLNLGYFFGTLGSYRDLSFNALDPYYYNAVIKDSRLSAFVWNLGAQYRIAMEKPRADELAKKFLTVGVYGNTATDYESSTNTNFRRIGSLGIDTILNTTDQISTGTLPSEWTLGAMYEEAHQGNPVLKKWRVGADLKITTAPDASTKSASRLAVGMEYMPEPTNYRGYWRRVKYRAGFQSFTDPRLWKGEQLGGWNVTAGFGFPIQLPREQSFAQLHLGFEYGKFAAGSIVSENYFKVNLGFTFNDNTWFLKRKFN